MKIPAMNFETGDETCATTNISFLKIINQAVVVNQTGKERNVSSPPPSPRLRVISPIYF